MKILPDVNPAEFETPDANTITLPQGIIGFAAYTRAELLYQPDQLPFLWLRLHNATDSICFIVVEPCGVISGYDPELFDKDAAALEITRAEDAMVLNIVALKNQNPLDATVNLVGPIVVNRRTRIGRQLILANYSRYSANFQLVDSRIAVACA